MSLSSKVFKASLWLLKIPAFAAYGIWTLVAGSYRFARRTSARLPLLGMSLPCPHCETENLLDGRWKCRACSAVYQGVVWECALCGSGASFFSCEDCGISISLTRHLP